MPLDRLKLTNISKSYAGGLANNRVNLTIKPQEIQALLGENGAGKSTLMKIVYGLVRSDAGQIEWEGQQVNISSPAQARLLGINMVFQHFSLYETLTVTENIALAQPKHEKWNLARLANKIRQLSDLYGLSVDPNRPIHSLSAGERQRVEIIRCLRQTTKLLILDEPTAVLTPQETKKLFSTLLIAADPSWGLEVNATASIHEALIDLRDAGCAVLVISKDLDELFSLCDRIGAAPYNFSWLRLCSDRCRFHWTFKCPRNYLIQSIISTAICRLRIITNQTNFSFSLSWCFPRNSIFISPSHRIFYLQPHTD